MSDVTERQKASAEAITDGTGENVWQTFESCRQLIALCRAMDHSCAPDGAEMGMYRVLGLVDDALCHLEGNVRGLLKVDKEEAES